MRITKKLLIEKEACNDGIKWFEKHFPNLDADYQEVLTQLGKDNKPSYAEWLFNNFGSTDDVLEVDEIFSDSSFFFAGQIIVKGNIEVKFSIMAGRGIEAGRGIKAGWDIEAGWGIKAGRGIEAGRGIKAGWGIKAGGGFGIFAGLRIKICDWKILAEVSAKDKPENLISGHWKE